MSLNIKELRLTDGKCYHNLNLINVSSVEEIFTDCLFIYGYLASKKSETVYINVNHIVDITTEEDSIPPISEEEAFYNILQKDFGVDTRRRKEKYFREFVI